MVLCKAYDKYLKLLKDDVHPVQSEQDVEQDIENAIVKFCREAKTVKEIVEHFNFSNRLYLKRHYLDKLLKEKKLKMAIPDKTSSKNTIRRIINIELVAGQDMSHDYL